MRLQLIGAAGWGFCAMVASASAAAASDPAELTAGFQQQFEAQRIRSYQASAAFARKFVSENDVKGAEQFIVPVLSDADARLRFAALVALDAMGSSDQRFVPLLQRALNDPDSKIRLLVPTVVIHLYKGSLPLALSQVDAALWDRDHAVRKLSLETVLSQIEIFRGSADPGLRAELGRLLDGLESQPHLAEDTGDEPLVDALKSRLRAAISTIDRNALEVRSPVDDGKWSFKRIVVRVTRLYASLSEPWQAAVVIISLVVLIHLYYLCLFIFVPKTLFKYLYADYPLFLVPYLLAPTLYRKTVRPAISFLRPPTQPSHQRLVSYLLSALYRKTIGLALSFLRRPTGPSQQRLVENLWNATLFLSSQKRERVADAITERMKNAGDDEELLASLFKVLTRIDQSRALAVMDLAPEDREIKAARKNMSKIMDLPDEMFEREGLELSHQIRQATSISADFYKVIPRGNESYAVYMVDVNGHGLSASLQAMQVSLALEAASDWGMGRPRRELEMADEFLRRGDGHLLVTMNFLEIDLADRKVRYANAGMPPAYLFSSCHPEPKRLMAVGVYVGGGYSFFSPRPLEAVEPISAGDLIVLCSDGILEARGPDGHTFGESRLIAAVKNCRTGETADIAQAIMRACETYTGRARPADDQSVIVIRIAEGAQVSQPATNVVAGSLNVVAEDERGIEVTLRRSSDWPAIVRDFLEKHALPCLSQNSQSLETRARFQIAVQEALYNALTHGADYDECVSVSIRRLSEGKVEVIITQPRDWPTWDKKLGSQTSRKLKEHRAAMRNGEFREPLLGGTVLISQYADSASCTSKGRRLTLRFSDQHELDSLESAGATA